MGCCVIVPALFDSLESERNTEVNRHGEDKTYHGAAAPSTPSLPTSQPANTMPIVSLYSVTKE